MRDYVRRKHSTDDDRRRRNSPSKPGTGHSGYNFEAMLAYDRAMRESRDINRGATQGVTVHPKLEASQPNGPAERKEDKALSLLYPRPKPGPSGYNFEAMLAHDRALREGRDVNRGATQGVTVHPKLQVSSPSDPAEREADAIADKVMRMPEPANASCSTCGTPIPDDSVHRKCATCDEEEKIHPKHQNSTNSGMTVSGPTADGIRNLSGGQPIPEVDRNFMEPRFGRDFSDVRLHTGSKASELSERINARAFTHGNNIAFQGGEYRPGTERGRRLLAHELGHVGQEGIQLRRSALTEDDLAIIEQRGFITTEEADAFYRELGIDIQRLLDHRAYVDGFPQFRLRDQSLDPDAEGTRFQVGTTNSAGFIADCAIAARRLPLNIRVRNARGETLWQTTIPLNAYAIYYKCLEYTATALYDQDPFSTVGYNLFPVPERLNSGQPLQIDLYDYAATPALGLGDIRADFIDDLSFQGVSQAQLEDLLGRDNVQDILGISSGAPFAGLWFSDSEIPLEIFYEDSYGHVNRRPVIISPNRFSHYEFLDWDDDQQRQLLNPIDLILDAILSLAGPAVAILRRMALRTVTRAVRPRPIGPIVPGLSSTGQFQPRFTSMLAPRRLNVMLNKSKFRVTSRDADGNVTGLSKTLEGGVRKDFRLWNGRWEYEEYPATTQAGPHLPRRSVREHDVDSYDRNLARGTERFFEFHHPFHNSTMQEQLARYGYNKNSAPAIVIRNGFRTRETPHGYVTREQAERPAPRNFEEEWLNVRRDLAELNVPAEQVAELERQAKIYFGMIYRNTPANLRASVWGNWSPDL